ncbi:MAG: hypothetical protein KC983_10755, partial [Phycisphaerales bacterium]|nr:hypothetical protein [Phycisphaerales bacterium]
FRQGSAALDSPLPSFAEQFPNVRLLASTPALTTPANVQIVSIEPVRRVVLSSGGGGIEQVLVRLARQDGVLDRAMTRVRLEGDGLAAIEPLIVNWEPGQSTADVEFMIDVIAPDDREITLTATIDRDALDADNTRHVLLDLRDHLRVLLIDRRRFGFEPSVDRLTAGAWIRRALEPTEDGPMELVEVEPAALDIADTRLAEVVLLIRPDLLPDRGWSMLRTYVDGGGLLVIAPPGELNVHQWTEQLSSALGLGWQIELEADDSPEGFALADAQPASEVLRLLSSELAILAPPVRVYRRLIVDPSDGEAQALLELTDGSPLLLAGTPGTAQNSTAASNGLVVLMTSTPELAWTNLPSKPLMVPLMHELIHQGLGVIRSAARYDVGAQPPIRVAFRDARALTLPSGTRVSIADDGRPTQPLRAPGVYTVIDRGQQSMGLLAVNVDPGAGDVTAQSTDDVSLWLRSSGE